MECQKMQDLNLFAAFCLTRVAEAVAEATEKADRSAESNSTAFVREVGACLMSHDHVTESFMPSLENIEGHIHRGELVNIKVHLYSKTLGRRVSLTVNVDE